MAKNEKIGENSTLGLKKTLAFEPFAPIVRIINFLFSNIFEGALGTFLLHLIMLTTFDKALLCLNAVNRVSWCGHFLTRHTH